MEPIIDTRSSQSATMSSPRTQKKVVRGGDENAERVKVAPHVIEVCIKGPLSSRGFEVVAEKLHTGIEVLDLTACGFDDRVLTCLANRKLPRLRVFRAGGNPNFSGKAVIAFLSSLDRQKCRLEELSLAGLNKLTSKHVREIAEKSSFVRRLDLSGIAVSNEAFEESWTHVDELKLKECQNLDDGRVHKWPAIVHGGIRLLELGRNSESVNAERLINALPRNMSHLRLGRVTGSLEELGKKIPFEELDLSGTAHLTGEHLEAVFGTRLRGLHVSGCRELDGKFFEKLGGLPLKRLSVGGTIIDDSHLKGLPLQQLEALDLSHCDKLTGEGLCGLKLARAKVVSLEGLEVVDDAVLGSMRLPRDMKRLSLLGTSVTLKGVAAVLQRSQIGQVVLPSATELCIEDGLEWHDAQFISLLPHLPRTLERVELRQLTQLSKGAWENFACQVPASVVHFTVEGLEKFNVIQTKSGAICVFESAKESDGTEEITKFQPKEKTLFEAQFRKGMNMVAKKEEGGKEFVKKAADRGWLPAQVKWMQWMYEEDDWDETIEWLGEAMAQSDEGKYWGGSHYFSQGNDEDKRKGRELLNTVAIGEEKIRKNAQERLGISKSSRKPSSSRTPASPRKNAAGKFSKFRQKLSGRRSTNKEGE